MMRKRNVPKIKAYVYDNYGHPVELDAWYAFNEEPPCLAIQVSGVEVVVDVASIKKALGVK